MCFVHSDISIDHVPPELTQLLEVYRGSDILIAMDANNHSSMWCSHETNPWGNMIEELIFYPGITVCNRGSWPTFVGEVVEP